MRQGALNYCKLAGDGSLLFSSVSVLFGFAADVFRFAFDFLELLPGFIRDLHAFG